MVLGSIVLGMVLGSKVVDSIVLGKDCSNHRNDRSSSLKEPLLLQLKQQQLTILRGFFSYESPYLLL